MHMTVAEPSGASEALTGRADGRTVELRSVSIALVPGADDVTATARRFFLEDGTHDRLVAEVDIAVNGEELQPHTRSVLRRISGRARGDR